MTLPAPAPDFRLAHPRDIEAAVALRGAQPSSRFLAGGTDLVVNLRRGLDQPALLIDLSAIDELHGLALTERGARIGACTTATPIAYPTARVSQSNLKDRGSVRRPRPWPRRPRHSR